MTKNLEQDDLPSRQEVLLAGLFKSEAVIVDARDAHLRQVITAYHREHAAERRIVGVLWGAVLIASLIPHGHVSWEGHLTGALGGVIAAWLLARRNPGRGGQARWSGSRERHQLAAYPAARPK